MREKARQFAIKAHGEQKYGDFPYSVHLDAVAKIASKYGETAEAVAFLHDVVEDTDVTVDDIVREFGESVAEYVDILTDEPGKNRKERKRKTFQKMSQVSGDAEIALLVKASDRLANIKASITGSTGSKSLLRMYKKEHATFKEAVYRNGFGEDLWLEMEDLIGAGE